MVNQQERAYKTWQVLAKLASGSKLITYEELAKNLNSHARAVRFPLSLIQDYCQENHLPPLTILVVNKTTNQPGEGFIAWGRENLVEGRNEVRSHDWKKNSNPFAYALDGTSDEELINRILTAPDLSQEVYSKVKVRGVAQMIFRQALLTAYDGRCAFTETSFAQTLDAAHIVPWSECTPDLRMDPRNGILMLCFHHRLFDLGILSIDEDYKIHFSNKQEMKLTEADHNFVSSLHRMQISLPSDKSLWPDKKLIRRRNNELNK